MQPDPTILRSFKPLKACALEMIGHTMLEQEDLTEDEAKKGLLYLDDS